MNHGKKSDHLIDLHRVGLGTIEVLGTLLCIHHSKSNHKDYQHVIQLGNFKQKVLTVMKNLHQPFWGRG